jgi:CHAT domain-containing protein/predicted negative regulator of RcsB-dependent stress response
MRSRIATSYVMRGVQIVFGVLCLALAGTVRAPVVSAHLSGPNQQTSQEADALLQLSAQQNTTDHQLALQTANQAMQIFQSLNDEAGIARVRMHFGEYQTAQGNLAEAKESFEAALTFWQQQNNIEQQAITLLELSFIEQRKGDWSSALAYLNEAQPLVNEQSQPGQAARIANSFGAIYNENGWPELALGEYQRSREYFQRAGEVRQSHRMTLLIGYTYLLQQKYPEAATHMNEALTNLSHELDKAQCHEYLGQLYIALNEYPVALQHLQTSLPIYEAAHNIVEAARVLALIGQIQEQHGALSLARASYLQTLQTFQRVRDRVNESAISFALGKLELKARNYDSAETYLKRSIETTESLRGASIGRDLRTAYAATVYDRYQAYVDCLVRKHKLQPSRGLDTEALQASELARARSLAELLSESKKIRANDPHADLAKREIELRQAIRDKMDLRTTLLVKEVKDEANKTDPTKATKTADPVQRKQQLAQVETSLSEVHREHARVAEQLRRKDPLRNQIIEPTAYTLEQIQNEVIADDETVLLEYLLAEEASYAWVVTRKDAKVYELPNRALINEAAQKVYKLLSKRPNGDGVNNDLEKAAKQLSEMVLSPLAGHLSAQRLIIVADGALHYVPFQLLPQPNAGAEPLIARYEIVNAPSASILGELRKEKQRRRPTTRLLAAFGDPVFASNYAEYRNSNSGELTASAKTLIEPWQRAWRNIELSADKPDLSAIQPLTYSKFELQKLSELGGPSSMVARGFEASRDTLTKLDLSQYAVLHFATHALLDPKHPESTGFFLSMLDASGRPQNGFITTPDVYSLRAPVDLAVLSACSTGLGKDARGEGLIGLTSGFMYAGASSVAASLWKVDDQATAELMEQFYANMLLKGMRPAEALRLAQNTLRKDPRWQSPHYWAGFTFQGDYQNTIRIPTPKGTPPKVQNAVGIALLLILLAGIGWGFWRRRQPRSVS